MFHPVRWSDEHVRSIGAEAFSTAPRIAEHDVVPIASDLDVWDAWPIQDKHGAPFSFAANIELWMALGAPKFPDPDTRHDHARIHLLQRNGERWHHLGQAMPEGFSPGSREWSGSAVANEDGSLVELYFTAAGRRGESSVTFEQRMFCAVSDVVPTAGSYQLSNWRDLREVIARDPAVYMPTTNGVAGVGKIKAFRDPAYFYDPQDGAEYLFFAGSCASSSSDFNGVIGIARREGSDPAAWRTLPPLISADGLNNELERPHVIRHGGLYYLFWSMQRHVFDPTSHAGPTGLYGMVSDNLFTGWQPLNGTGLVFANPVDAAAQAYSWFVLPDLQVTSFVDDWAGGPTRSFGGTFAPFLRLWLDGASAGTKGLKA